MAAGAVRKELWGKILVLGKAEHESESTWRTLTR
jgi:hypothetical protein